MSDPKQDPGIEARFNAAIAFPRDLFGTISFAHASESSWEPEPDPFCGTISGTDLEIARIE